MPFSVNKHSLKPIFPFKTDPVVPKGSKLYGFELCTWSIIFNLLPWKQKLSTFDFKYPHKKKSRGERSGERGGYSLFNDLKVWNTHDWEVWNSLKNAFLFMGYERAWNTSTKNKFY